MKIDLLLPCLLACVLVSSTGCKAKDKAHDDASTSSTKEKEKEKEKGSKSSRSKSSEDESSSGDDPAEGIAACADWRKKISACGPLQKSAPSLIDKTKDLWRIKKLSKSDIEKDCKDKIDLLPSICR